MPAQKPIYHEKETIDALNKIATIKGVQRAKRIEQIIRCETAHLTSLQWRDCKCAGMEKGNWANLDESKLTYITMNDNHPEKVKALQRVFIKWNSVFDFCMYLSDYIDRHKNDGGYARWNSKDLNKQARYMKEVEGIKNRYI